jgi:hypothetical protein
MPEFTKPRLIQQEINADTPHVELRTPQGRWLAAFTFGAQTGARHAVHQERTAVLAGCAADRRQCGLRSAR